MYFSGFYFVIVLLFFFVYLFVFCLFFLRFQMKAVEQEVQSLQLRFFFQLTKRCEIK